MYRHLACFHPVSNDPQNRKKFCPRAIIAIDFSSSCHVDRGDDQQFCEESIKSRLLMDELKEQGLASVSSTLEEVRNCLRHVTWWGVCLPTTCYYQYISKRNDIEVYQWFLCPELGTTYRIKNYWVHHFLAGFFLTEHWL